MATTQVDVVAPTGMLFSGEADMVVCRTAGGDIAFLANHAAYVGALEPCTVRVVHPQGAAIGAAAEELHYEVQGGFVEVNANRVVVLCDTAQRVD